MTELLEAERVLTARVSTTIHQDPEMQIVELRECADQRGWKIFGEYTTRGIGVKNLAQSSTLLVDANRRRFDAVLVWKIDRFDRSLKHLVNAFAARSIWRDWLESPGWDLGRYSPPFQDRRRVRAAWLQLRSRRRSYLPAHR